MGTFACQCIKGQKTIANNNNYKLYQYKHKHSKFFLYLQHLKKVA